MRYLLFILSAIALLAFHTPAWADSQTDGATAPATTPEDDTGDTEDDTGEAKDDTGETEDDTGEAKDDTGETEDDTGEDEDDTGETEDDTGETEDDTGETEDVLTTHPAPMPDEVPLVDAPKPSKSELRQRFITWKTNINAGWKLEKKHRVQDAPITNEFYVKRARFKLIAEPLDWLKGVIQVDAADALSRNFVKDAYIHLAPLRSLQLRVGQFKKPFSELRLTSSDKLRLIERGEGNEAIVKDLRYGDRDLGLLVSGRIVDDLKLDYSIGVFNGSGPNIGDPSNAKDIVARVDVTPFKRFKLGVNGSLKFIDDPKKDQGQPSFAHAWGGDISFRHDGLRLFAQVMWAQDHALYNLIANPKSDSPPELINAVANASYQHQFDTPLALAVEPAFQFEFLDPQLKIVDDTVFLYTAGLNTYIGRYVRVMLNARFVRTSRNTMPARHIDSEELELLLCLTL
jgi:hypothetical protein